MTQHNHWRLCGAQLLQRHTQELEAALADLDQARALLRVVQQSEVAQLAVGEAPTSIEQVQLAIQHAGQHQHLIQQFDERVRHIEQAFTDQKARLQAQIEQEKIRQN